jgi:hypothetical protein
LQRAEAGYAPAPRLRDSASTGNIKTLLHELRGTLTELDARIAELAREAGSLGNQRWGPLLRAGNDKSRMARQIERYADIYTSRVSNLLHYTPFAYLRPPAGTLPHDRE